MGFTIPISVYFVFIFMSFIPMIIGLVLRPRFPAGIGIIATGCFIFAMTAVIDNIIMGYSQDGATVKEIKYQFTNVIKVFFVFFGSVIILIGGLATYAERDL